MKNIISSWAVACAMIFSFISINARSLDQTCGSITALKIYDQVTDTEAPGIGPITNGTMIPLSDLPANYYLTIETTGTIESVVLSLDGSSVTENVVPYTYPSGADAGSNWNGGIGTYNLTADAYLNDNAVDHCDNLTVSFSIVEDIQLPTAPTCSAGSFLWENDIIENNGIPPFILRFIDGGTNNLTLFTIPGPYPAAFSGPVYINIAEAISWDGYVGRTNTGDQPNEQWKVVFREGGSTIYETGYTNDLITGVESDEWLGPLGSQQFFPNGVDEIILVHFEDPTYGSGSSASANSVSPSSLCFEYETCNLTITGSTLPNEACITVPVNPNCDCNGNVASITALFNGTSGSNVTVYNDNETVVLGSFSNVSNGQVLFVEAGAYNGGEFDNKTFWQTNSETPVEIHTSCSQDIAGMTFGDFTVIGYTDSSGGVCNPLVCTGSADISVTSGAGPYTYSWPNGSTDEDPTGLCEGDYTVTVTDANGCSGTATFNVAFQSNDITTTVVYTEPDPCVPEILGICDCLCEDQIVSMTLLYGGANGADVNIWNDANHSILIANFTNVQNGDMLFADATGVLPGDDFENSTFIEIVGGDEISIHTSCSDDIGGLTFGDFTVTGFTDVPGNICDASNCIGICECSGGIADITLIYNGPSGVNAGAYDGTDPIVLWNNVQNGQFVNVNSTMIGQNDLPNIDIIVDGVNLGEVHTSCSDDIQGMQFGDFTVVSFIDSNGNECSVLDCNGEIDITVLGNGPFTYLWSTGQSSEDLINICAGTYEVTVTDANSCSETFTFVLTCTICNLSVNAGSDVGFCPGSSVTLNATISGASSCPAPSNSDVTYLWSTGETTQSILVSPSNTTTYTVTVTDCDGCTASDDVIVSVLGCGPECDTMDDFFDNCGTSVSGDVSANDISSPGDYTVTSPPVSGDLAFNSDGTFTYTNANPGTYTFMVETCGMAVPPPNETCTMGVSEMTVEYLGPNNATVEVTNKDGSVTFQTFNNVQNGDILVIQNNTGILNGQSNTWDFYINGSFNTEIHTSCSVPLLGLVFGDFQVLEYVDGNGNLNTSIECCESTVTITLETLRSIGDLVWQDNNGDGCQNFDEPGISGVTVELFECVPGAIPANNNGIIVETTTTDSNGNYSFSDCFDPNKDYYVQVSDFDPSLNITDQDSNSCNDTEDSDVDPATGKTDCFQIPPGDTPDFDIGLTPSLSIGSTVFADINDNGTQDPGELGLQGILVEVWSVGPDGVKGGGDDILIGSDVTDISGNYFIDGLEAGDYYVKINTVDSDYPTSSTDTATSADPNNNTDSDDNGIQDGGPGTMVMSNVITLTAGDEPTGEPGPGGDQDAGDDDNGNMTVDFGFVPYFDLALTKELSSAGPFAPGDDVTYTITVINQGTADATSITLKDYAPVGMTNNDPDWNVDGTYDFGPLAAGATATVDVTLTIDGNFNGTSLVNYAEISDATNPAGSDDIDSTPDGDNTNDAGGDPNSAADDAVDGDGTGTPGDGDPLTDEDDHDPSSIDVEQVVSLGSTVFADVNNNGTQDPGEPGIPGVVVDVWSVGPDGLKGGGDDVLVGTQTTDADGEFWFTDLIPGDYYLKINTPDPNHSTSSTDTATSADPNNNTDSDDNGIQDGGPGTMVMSNVITLTAGDEPAGEPGPGGNQDAGDDDNGNMTVDFGFVPYFDLALTKDLSSAGPFSPGDEVTYTITVINQGAADATSITLTDYAPVGMTNNDPDWNVDGTYDFGPLAAGATATVDVTLTIDGNFNGTSLVNYAEISDATNPAGSDDIDSTPDGDNTNDAGGDPNSAADDAVDGDGTGTPGDGDPLTDEDDHDPSSIDVEQVVSLGSTVFVDVNNNGTQDPGEPGIDGIDVQVNSVGPDGVKGGGDDVLAGSDTTDANGNYYIDGLAPGDYYLVINDPDADYPTSSTDTATSTDPNNNTDGDDNGIQDGGPGTMVMSNVITLTAGDEPTGEPGPGGNQDAGDDDNGNMTVDFGFVPYFDLALTKDLSSAGPFAPGDDVTYTITVINQGTADATSITLKDYAPVGMTNNDPDWNANGTYDFGALAAGATATVDVTLTIDGNFNGPSLVNYAEISDATNPAGSDDIDSTPDGDNTNDAGGDPNSAADDAVDGDGTGTPGDGDPLTDEDDHDPSSIDVEQVVSLGSTVFADVNNNGTQDPGEPGIPGVVVDVWSVGPDGLKGGGDDVLVGTQTTDADGEFWFTDLIPGDYYLKINTPDPNHSTSSTDTATSADPNNNTDSDDNGIQDGGPGTMVMSNVITLTAGDEPAGEPGPGGNQDAGDDDNGNMTVDFGFVPYFDLALTKDLSSAGPFSPGDEVTYTITVINQGAADATSITLTDYAPVGMTNNDPDWNVDGTYDFGPLAAGATATVDVTLTIDGNFNGPSLVNYAEISDATNPAGSDDIDSTPDGDNTNDAGGDPNSAADDAVDGDGTGTPGDGDPLTDEDDHDPSSIDVEQVVSLGSTVFADVNNNGTQDPGEPGIPGVVVDVWSVGPDGLKGGGDDVLVGTQTTDADGEFWFTDLIPGDYYLKINTPDPNHSTSSTDTATSADPNNNTDSDDNGIQDGGPGTMVMSNVITLTAGDEPTGEPGPGGNQDAGDDDNGNMTVDFGFVPYFDLALTKDLSSAGPFSPGDDVTYTITVINQGAADATSITLTDYAPVGMTNNDPDWNVDGTYDFGPLAAGATATVDVTLTIDGNFNGTSLVNYAEISDATNPAGSDDIDSTPDGDNTNDAGGDPNSAADDAVDGDGTGTPGDGDPLTDEDDHDPSSIDVEQVVSLGSTVFVDVNNNGTQDPGEPGIDGIDVQVYSVGPDGVKGGGDDVLAGSDTTDANGNYYIDGLAPGDYYLVINDPDADYPTSSTDTATSTDPNNNTDGDDNGIQDGGPGTMVMSNVITLTAGDEPTGEPGPGGNQDAGDDDNGNMTVDFGFVPYFDLALTKELSSAGPFAPGDDVTYTITVINQGTADATSITLKDYAPVGMTNNDPDWNANGTYDFGALAAGATATVDVTLTIDGNFNGPSLVNYAEISDATNPAGSDDIDSTPDGDNTNDAGGDPNSAADDAVDGDGTGTPGDGDPLTDEDDHDPSSIDVEQVVSLGSTVFADVNNNGTQDPGEPGIPGVVVDVWSVGPDGLKGGGDDVLVGTQTTDADGEFWFTDLIPGDYYLKINTPDPNHSTSSTDTATSTDPNNNTDGDDNGIQDGGPGTMVMSNVITLTAGDEPTGEPGPGGNQDAGDDDNGNMTVDFGFVPYFDLALTKELSSAGPFAPGDDVTYTITVINQGAADATSITLTDYAPVGMTNNDPDWNVDGTYDFGPLAAGATATVDVTLTIDGNFNGTSLVNYAEISDATNPAGSDDIDSTPDGDNTNDAGGDPNSAADDAVDGDGTGTPGDGDPLTDEDDHDPSSIDVEQVVSLGSTVFVDVNNNGTQDPGEPGIDGIDVQVYSVGPDGVKGGGDDVLAGSDTTDANGNYYIDGLAPGDYYLVINDPDADYPTSSTDTATSTDPNNNTDGDDNGIQNGGSGTMVMSNVITLSAGDEPTGEPGPGGNQDAGDDDNGNMTVDFGFVPYFDLALTKELSSAGPFAPGDDVTYTITVINQGTADATSVTLTDYAPVGMTNNDPDWNANGTYDFGALAAGATATVDVTLTIDGNFNGTSLVNYAEISDATNPAGSDDIDSTPDGDNTNDAGGGPDSAADDAVDGDGTGTPGDGDPLTDEDDHDPSSIDVVQTTSIGSTVFVDVNNNGTQDPGEPGIDGIDVQVYSVGPDGVKGGGDDVLAGSDTTDANGNYYIDGLAPGDYYLVINDPDADYPTSSTDTATSTDPNNNTDGDDNGIQNGGSGTMVMSNVITLSAGDEPTGEPGPGGNQDAGDDDNGNMTVDFGFVPYFDLALTKELSSAGPFAPGDDVTYTITVINQGTADATSVTLTDYAPVGMTNNDPDWNANGTYDFGALAAGATATVDVTLTIDGNFNGTSLVNYAEISDATNPAGSDDIDSTPDGDNTNDAGGDPNSAADDAVDGDGTGTPGDGDPLTDEDDHDPSSIDVVQTTSIGSTVFVDVNNNGTQDPGEPGIDGIDVQVYSVGPDGVKGGGDDVLAGSDTTDANGNYYIDGLAPGDYYLVINDPDADYPTSSTDTATSTDPNNNTDGDDNGIQNGGSGTMVMSNVITLTAGDEPTGEPGPGGNQDAGDDDNGNMTVDFGFVPYFDLALTKELSSAGPFAPGDDVTYTITVINQGTADATSVTLTDYAPVGMTNNDPDWNANGTYDFGVLAAGATATVDVTLTIDGNFNGTSLVNYAEISDATNPAGSDDIDSTPDGDNTNDAGGGPDSAADDAVDGDGTGTPGDGDPLTDEDDHDPSSIDVVQTTSIGSTVFVDVNNNGTQDPGEPGIDGIDVQVYSVGPDGVKGGGDDVLAGSDTTDANGNYYIDGLAPGDYYLVINDPDADYPTSSTDTATSTDPNNNTDGDDNGIQNGGSGTMVMSNVITLSAGDEPTGEPGPGGNQDAGDDDNGNMTVDFGFVPYFDLALTKELSSAGPFAPGDDVTYTITVINQGTADATSVTLTDYAPAGMTNNDPDWNANGTYDFGALAAGATATVDVTLTIDGNFNGTSLVNYAEISDATNPAGSDDIDSTPDGDNTNDAGGGPDSAADDAVDGDGTGTPGDGDPLTDEDDHDPSSIDVVQTTSIGSTVFVDVNNNGTQDPGEPGIDGIDVQVYSVGPDGVKGGGDDVLAGSDTTDANGNYYIDGLAPGDYYLVINDPDADYPTSSTDTATSTDPNNNTDGDDNGIQNGGSGTMVMSNVITLSAGDEPTGEPGPGGNQDAGDDDNGNMTVDFGFVPYFDLALTKELSSAGPFAPGDDVTYTITVINQGTADATSVTLTDYAPAGMTNNDPDWNANGTYDFGALAAGATATVDVTLTIDGNFNGTSLVNYAEISDATNPAGSDDIDSTPDGDNTNDAGGDPNSPADDAVDGDGTGTPGDGDPLTDEDDHDPSSIDVVQTTSIGSTVFVDVNNNGTQDPGEPGIDGIDVQVYSVGPDGVKGGGDDVLAGSDTTDANGNYYIDGLAPGDYYLVINDPDADYPTSSTDTATSTDPNNNTDGDDNGIQNGGSGTMVMSNVITLSAGDEPTGEPGPGGNQDAGDDDNGNMTVDFGFVPYFDLALTKELSSAGPFAPGDDVTYTITVINQGTADATSVTLTDYAPVGMTNNDPDWNANGTYDFGALAAGATATVDVTLTIDGNFNGPSLVNYAEISDATNPAGSDDIDSTPDGDNTNDAGGDPNSAADDVVDGDGTGTPGDGDPLTDEDDHDPAKIFTCDVEGPIIEAIESVTLPCNSDTPAPDLSLVIATDVVGILSVDFVQDIETINGCTKTVDRTYSATDLCDNISFVTQIITIPWDFQIPVISCPADVTISCEEDQSPANTGSATATDNCTASPTISSSDLVSLDGCNGTGSITRIWTATDECGNSSSCSQTITVTDTTAPVLTGCPADATVDCSAVPAAAIVTATDDCSAIPLGVVLSETSTPGSCAGNYTLLRTWTATDECGNSSSCSQTITVSDTTAPVLTGCPADATVDCSAVPAAAVVTATDDCSAIPLGVVLSETSTPGSCAGNYTLLRTWTATDECGNSSSCSQTITVTDTTAPVLTGCPADATVDCSAVPAAAVVTATDDCSAIPLGVVLSETSTPGSCAGNYTLLRTWTATDECGNSSSCSQTITVTDTTAPMLTGCPADATVDCSAVPAAATVTATDDCSAIPLGVVLSETSTLGSCAGNYTLLRTWTATDECGNSSSCSQTITVTDTTAPVLTGCPADATVDCSDVPAPAVVTATDDCSAIPLGVVLSETSTPGSCAGNYTLVRTWTATDECGNSSSCSQSITVSDTTAPVLTGCPADATVDCSAVPAAAIVTAADDCSTIPLGVVLSETSTPGSCAGNYTLLRTWTAMDECGNTNSCSQTITVTDTTAPVLTGCPADATVDCSAVPAAATVTATDDCSAIPLGVVLSETSTPGSCAGNYTLVRTWTATDECGNSSSCSQSITVSDTTAPVLTGCPADATVDCSAVPAAATVTATDDCSAIPLGVVLSETSTPGSCAGNYTLVRTWTATDECGNSSSCSQSITVSDTTAPVLTGCPADATVDCSAVPAAAIVTATDDCSAIPLGVVLSETSTPGSCAGNYTLLRTWTATDECGNSSSCSQTLTVTDTTAPVLVGCPADVTVDCSDVPAPAVVTATDDCSAIPLGVVLSETSTPGSCASNNYTLLRTWTATDECGNSSSCSQMITVTDTTAPVLTGCPADAIVDCSDVPAPAVVTATDGCGANPVSVSYSETNTPGFCAGNYTLTRTWTATDECGNTDSCSQTITVTDLTAPVLSGQGTSITLNCPGSISFDPPIASDNCDPLPSILFTDNTVPGNCQGTFTITRTWTAVDACLNISAAVSQSITVQDTTPPVLDDFPIDITVPCDQIPEPPVCTATDECDSNVQVFFEQTEGLDCNFAIMRTWTALDDCGNTSSYTQVITVVDVVAPVLFLPDDQTLECDQLIPLPFYLVEDNCDNDPDVVVTEIIIPGDCPQEYILERTYTATDLCGNSSSETENLSIVDNNSPVIVPLLVDSVTKNCTELGLSLFDLFDFLEGDLSSSDSLDLLVDIQNVFEDCDLVPASFDICGTAEVIASNIIVEGFNSVAYPETGYLEIEWQSIDECGNLSTTISTSITVVDTAVPGQVFCQDISVELGPDGFVVVDAFLINNGSLDECSPLFFSLDRDTLNCDDVGNHVATLFLQDLSGNIASCSANITVSNNHSSGLICPPDVNAEADPGQCTASVENSALLARSSDPCETLTITHIVIYEDGTTSSGGADATGDYPVGTHIINWTAIGEDGTIYTCSTSVTILTSDDEAPIVICQNITAVLNNYETTVPVVVLSQFSSDNCSMNLTYTVGGEEFIYFYCEDLGLNTVIIEVTDEAGNVATCTSIIEVEDPLGNCTPDPCPAPTGLDQAFLANSVLLSWTPPAGAEACQITGGVVGGAQVSLIKYAPNVFQHYVPNNILNPTADYQWRVRCACDLDPLIVSPFSPYNFFNKSNPAVEDPDVDIIDNSSNELILSKEYSISIQPNPNDGIFSISTNMEGHHIRILDITGKVIYQKNGEGENSHSIDISNVQSGMYYIQMYNEESIITEKILIER